VSKKSNFKNTPFVGPLGESQVQLRSQSDYLCRGFLSYTCACNEVLLWLIEEYFKCGFENWYRDVQIIGDSLYEGVNSSNTGNTGNLANSQEHVPRCPIDGDKRTLRMPLYA